MGIHIPDADSRGRCSTFEEGMVD
eukprot:SAG11_NODE_45818_length_141_cov_74.619048_1_plen_23_part_10